MRFIAVLMSVLLAMPVSSAFYWVPAKSYASATIGMQAGSALAGYLNGIKELRAHRERFNKEIAAAREDFFSKYPDKPGVKEAGARFSALLAQKDAIILQQAVTLRQGKLIYGGDGGMVALLQDRSDTAENDFDGGLPSGAWGAFQIYENKMFQRSEEVFTAIIRSKVEYANTHEEIIRDYERYVLIRNYIEFARAGRSAGYFPSAEAYLQFAIMYDSDLALGGYPRSDEHVEDIYTTLSAVYGEKALLQVGDTLRKVEMNDRLWVVDNEKLGIPRESFMPLDTILALLGRDASPKAYALGILKTGRYTGEAFKDGEAAYDAMVKKHGEAKAHQVIKQVQAMRLGKKQARIASGEYAGSTPREALFLMLPVEGDPAYARRQARVEAIRAERERREAQAEAEAHQKNLVKYRALSEQQYDQFIKAYRMTKEADEKFNTEKYSDQLLEAAGLWNYAVKSNNADLSIYVAKNSARRVIEDMALKGEFKWRMQYRKQMIETIGFTQARWLNSRLDYLVPLEQIQQERIAAGKLSPEDALDLSMTPRKRTILKNLKDATWRYEQLQTVIANKASYEKKREDFTVEGRYKRWARAKEEYESGEMGRPAGWSEEDAIGRRILLNMIEARDQAIIGDHFKLKDFNRYLGYAQVDAVERNPMAELFITASAGLWNQYLIDGDPELLPLINACRTTAGNIDTFALARREYGELLSYPYVEGEDAETWSAPTPPMAIQRRLIASGELSPDQAINLYTDQEVYQLLAEYYLKHKKMEREILRVSYGSKPERKAQKQKDLAAALAELNAIQAKIDKIDAANGQPSRFSKVKAPLIAKLFKPAEDDNSQTAIATPKPNPPTPNTGTRNPRTPRDNIKAPDPPSDRGTGRTRPEPPPKTDVPKPDPPKPTDPRLRQPEPEAPKPLTTEDLGKTQLAAFVDALKQARESDAAALKTINEERKALELEPLETYTPAADLVQLIAGFWDAALAGTDDRGASNALKAITKVNGVDRQLFLKLKTDLGFVYKGLRGEVKPAAFSELQKADDPNALDLRATRERYDLILDYHQERRERLANELDAAQKRKDGDQRESTLRRLDAKAAKSKEKEAKALAELEQYDKENAD